jgi:hypothetical protein
MWQIRLLQSRAILATAAGTSSDLFGRLIG